jgi:iron(III) transport system ATP-binding protein
MLELEHISARFGAATALDDVSFTVAPREILCLLGPSGSGKSTLLRIIAGIEQPAAGRVRIAGEEVAGLSRFVEPERRRVGMVFQDYALFPHLTVAENVAFGARRRGVDIEPLLERLHIATLAGKYPHMLSGGERQRVALARAIAPQPRILLMDEPFSSLDSRLRDTVRRHTLEFLREAGTTTVIVTHDPDEALRIADRIALLDSGRLVQIGTPEELYATPSNLFAARFFGEVTAVPGTCRDGRLETAIGTFAAERVASGTTAVACLRAEHLTLSDAPAGLHGRIVGSEFCGEERRLLVALDGFAEPVALRVPREAANALAHGADVHVALRTREVPVVAAN